MTIKYLNGDIFAHNADAIVDPCNCLGVQGAGLSKAFGMRFPRYSKQYKMACTEGLVIGQLVLSDERENGFNFVIGVPTKYDFRKKSQIDFVDKGCGALVDLCDELDIKSINVPALGCGCGKLSFDDVKKVYEKHFTQSETLFNCFTPR